jgi:hypothetical protein
LKPAEFYRPVKGLASVPSLASTQILTGLKLWTPVLTVIPGSFRSPKIEATCFDQGGAMTVTAHTTKAFDSDLDVLSRMLGEMGQLAERQVAEATTALTTCDKTSAHQLVAADAAIDSIQRMIDKGVIEMIAKRQSINQSINIPTLFS